MRKWGGRGAIMIFTGKYGNLYIKILFVLVGWHVGWFVRLSRANGKAEGSGRFICRKNHPSQGINLAGVISGSGHIQGA